MRRHLFVVTAVLLVAALAMAAAERPNLAGTWVLNKDKSDDPAAKMREAMGGTPPPGPGGPGPRGFPVADQITIRQDGDKVEIDLGPRTLSYIADGQEREQEMGPGRTVPVVARWEAGKLVISSGGQFMKITTTYELSADGKELVVTRKMEGGRLEKPVEIRSVYEKKS